MNHTPGPWRFVNGKQIVSAQGETIAKVWMFRNGEGVANAHLIEQAPALLAELEKMLRLYDEVVSSEFEGTRMFDPLLAQANSARAAIAKARGET